VQHRSPDRVNQPKKGLVDIESHLRARLR